MTETLYHGSPSALPEIRDEGLFGGVFASASSETALSHGPVLHQIAICDSEILTQYELEYEVDHAKVMEILGSALPNLDEDDLMRAHAVVIEEKDIDIDGEEHLCRIMREDDWGFAKWEAQRLRGVVADALGYLAIEMDDEHGTSYLVLPGVAIAMIES